MRNLLKATFFLIAISSFSVFSHGKKFETSDNLLESKICLSIAKNNLFKYRHGVASLSSTRNASQLNRVVLNKLKCNGLSVKDFANKYNADRIIKYIAKFS